MPNYMILYCLDKQTWAGLRELNPSLTQKELLDAPNAGALALIYDKEHTDYISDPTDHATDNLILNLELLSIPVVKEE